MLYEEWLTPMISISDLATCSMQISLPSIIYRDKEVIARLNNSRVFCKGEMDELMKYLGKDSGPEVDYAKAIWSQYKD